jgi:hypothetical protein
MSYTPALAVTITRYPRVTALADTDMLRFTGSVTLATFDAIKFSKLLCFAKTKKLQE